MQRENYAKIIIMISTFLLPVLFGYLATGSSLEDENRQYSQRTVHSFQIPFQDQKAQIQSKNAEKILEAPFQSYREQIRQQDFARKIGTLQTELFDWNNTHSNILLSSGKSKWPCKWPFFCIMKSARQKIHSRTAEDAKALLGPKIPSALLARMFHELLSRDREDGCATGQPSSGTAGLDPRCTNGTSQGEPVEGTPEDAREGGHIRGPPWADS